MPTNRKDYDFGGWATKNDLKCSDGRIIRHGAFAPQDGKRVPLVWNHQHNNPEDTLGHAILENRDNGVYAYCYFNNTQAANHAKECVKHGDVTSLSIWANNLEQVGSEVLHGIIREVSLVLAGANPGAFIESVLAHGEPMEDGDEEGIFYTDSGLELMHADESAKKGEGEKTMPDANNSKSAENSEETVKDVYDTLTDKQKKAVAIIVGQAITDAKGDDSDDDEEEEEMKHNVFENDGEDVIVHSITKDQIDELFRSGKALGSMREAIRDNMENGGFLAHATYGSGTPTTGMDTASGAQTYGFNDPSMLFPDYKALSRTPEWISRNMDWVQKVLGAVHHTPFSRIKSVFADITADEARAKGYIKGNQKKEEVFATLKRTTDPQTIYKLQKMDRDDILDITDFDVLAWIKAEMRVMLNEEIARAILIGDGRSQDADDKIQENHVRPIATDVALFNTTYEIKLDENVKGEEFAKAVSEAMIRSRKYYKGSGNPTFFTTEDVLTEMLLLEDAVGHKLYKTEAEFNTAHRVRETVTVEPMEGHYVDGDTKEKQLIGIIVNMGDYNVGADKGGEINMFDDFDIDFNRQKYLIETRISGALIKPFSAITLVRTKNS